MARRCSFCLEVFREVVMGEIWLPYIIFQDWESQGEHFPLFFEQASQVRAGAIKYSIVTLLFANK